jgi:hypothetical protein
MWCRAAVVRTDVLEERIASIIRVERISELRTMLAVTSKWRTLLRNTNSECSNCQLLLKLFLARGFFPPWWWRQYGPPKHPFLQEPHGDTSQKAIFFKILFSLENCYTTFKHCLHHGSSLCRKPSSVSTVKGPRMWGLRIFICTIFNEADISQDYKYWMSGWQ